MSKAIIVIVIIVGYALLMVALTLSFDLDEKRHKRARKDELVDQCLKRLMRANELDNPYIKDDISKAIKLLEAYKKL